MTKDEANRGQYWWAKLFGFLMKDQNLKLDGTIYKSTGTEKGWETGGNKCAASQCFGYELTTISNELELHDKVAKKLIELAKGNELLFEEIAA